MYIVRHKVTGAIHTVSDKDDTVPPEGFEVVHKEGRLEDLKIADHPTNMVFRNGRFQSDNTVKANREREQRQSERRSKIRDEAWKIIEAQAERELIARGEIEADEDDGRTV